MTKQHKLIAAVILGLITAFAAWTWTKQYEGELRSEQFLKLKGNVALVRNETVITDEMIQVVDLPEKFASGLAAVAEPVDSRAALVGRRAIQDVSAGSILLKQFFAPELMADLSSEIAPGSRALTVSVNAESTVGYFVRPGSRVDLIGTFLLPSADNAAFGDRLNIQTRVVLRDVRILAVGTARSFSEYQRLATNGYATVTLQVTPEEANVLAFAQQQLSGPLTMVLRPVNEPNDPKSLPAPVDWKTFSQTEGVN